MTPKEKSTELYEKMLKQCSITLAGAHSIFQELAKGLALIAVAEIINELEQLRKPEYTTFVIEYGENAVTMDGYEKADYWQSVISEIEKL